MDSTTTRKITVAEMAPHIHSFLPDESKVNKLVKWLSNWILTSLASGKIKPNDLLPAKGDLACHIGVSQGTIQNVFRIIEDSGLVESKQRLGTYIKDKSKKTTVKKLTSKREQAIEIIKEYIINDGYKAGDYLTSTRNISKITGIADTTVRMAIINIVSCGILEKKGKRYVVKSIDYKTDGVHSETLVEKIAEEIEKYINAEFKPGDKLPPNNILTKKFNVSIKTIHDAIKILVKQGLLYTRRGRYGTIVSESKTELYRYEKIEQKIRQYIITKAKVGDKLPTIKAFSEMYNTSEKTIKKALDDLAEDGYIMFSRGRYGGSFVIDLPQKSNEAYKWLAINSDFISD